MTDLVTQFQQSSALFQQAVDKFPVVKREEKLFDQWPLKDVIAHLIGWNKFLFNSITQYQKHTSPDWYSKINDFNLVSVTTRQNQTFNEVLKEFTQTSDNLIKLFEKLDPKIQNSKIWPGQKTTPASFLKTLIHHSVKHLEQIKSTI